MIIDLHIAILLLQPQQIEYVIPLALLLYDIDIVIDQLCKLFLEDLAILPLVVDDRPDVLLFLLRELVGLEAVVELLDLVELDVAALFEFADFAFASCVEFY